MEGKRLSDVCDGGEDRPPVDRDDIVGILEFLGRECPGAVSAAPVGSPPGKRPGVLAEDYVPISDDQLAADLRNLYQGKPAKPGTEVSLAGVQSKIAVTVAVDGTLMEPRSGSGAPTTHILKVGDNNHDAMVANEFLCVKLATALGLAAVDCSMFNHGGVEYLLVPRYDREVDYVGGTVRRIHQEDCCQALALPPRLKYEHYGDRKSGRIADFVRLFSLNTRMAVPADYRTALAKTCFLNFLIGNSDAHAKNFSLIHDGRRPRLAPLYDLLNVSMYPSNSQELSMRIGGSLDGSVAGKRRWDDVGLADWVAFLTIAGFKGANAQRFIERQFRPMAEKAIPELARLAKENGVRTPPTQQIMDCLCERIDHLNKTFGWNIGFDASYSDRRTLPYQSDK
jgi:serine/threonine-protein kinase HipA